MKFRTYKSGKKTLAEINYQKALELIEKKDVEGLKRFGAGSGAMTLARSCAFTITSKLNATGAYYWDKEDELTKEFEGLFKANGIENINV